MTLSARNHLPGTVEEITLGGVNGSRGGPRGQQCGRERDHAQERRGNEAEEGDTVTAIIKSTEVMLEKS